MPYRPSALGPDLAGGGGHSGSLAGIGAAMSSTVTTHACRVNAHAFAGFLSGLCATAALYPLELVKVHTQRHHNGMGRPDLRAIFTDVVRREGLRASLYKGFGISLVGSSLAWGQYFYGYNVLKSANPLNLPPAWNHLASAFAAGCAVQALLCPLWVVKVNVQLGVYPGGTAGCIRALYRTEGLSGFYRGLTPGLWGCTQGAVQFMVYEAMRSKLQAYHGTEQLSPVDTMLATTIAKSASMIITNPITVLTVRMRDAGVRGYKYDNIWNSIRSILAKDGVLGFYRGVLVSLVRVMPAQWCTFVTYECVKDAILRYQEANCPGMGYVRLPSAPFSDAHSSEP
ncbi:hypothetical protein FOZ63_015283, partial [Perkinsus olseni]